MATSAEQLLLRGLGLVMRASFSPNETTAQAKHFAALTQDIAPWFKDYAEEIAKPAVDFTLTPTQPQLGCARTRELLNELRARTEVHNAIGLNYHVAHDLIDRLEEFIAKNTDGGLDYRTVDG